MKLRVGRPAKIKNILSKIYIIIIIRLYFKKIWCIAKKYFIKMLFTIYIAPCFDAKSLYNILLLIIHN